MYVSLAHLSKSLNETKKTLAFLFEVQKIMDKKLTKRMVSNLEDVPEHERTQLLNNLKMGISIDKAIEISKDPKRYVIKTSTGSDLIEIIDKQTYVIATDSFIKQMKVSEIEVSLGYQDDTLNEISAKSLYGKFHYINPQEIGEILKHQPFVKIPEVNNSFRMKYEKIFLCINSELEDYKDEKKNWDKYIKEYFDETETLERFILSIFNNTPVSEIKSLEYIELINLDPLLRQMVLNLLRKGWNLENVFKLLNEKI